MFETDTREVTLLSSNVLSMKFMQRSKFADDDKHSAAISNSSTHTLIDDEHWYRYREGFSKALNAGENSLVQDEESTYPNRSNLSFGRQSFLGMNPEIEKLMEEHTKEVELTICQDREKDLNVSVEEMAERYNSLVGTIGKKFNSKNKSSLKRKSQQSLQDINVGPDNKQQDTSHTRTLTDGASSVFMSSCGQSAKETDETFIQQLTDKVNPKCQQKKKKLNVRRRN